MKIILLVRRFHSPRASDGAAHDRSRVRRQEYSPYQMFASGLAVCTFGVLQSWGSNVGLSADDLVIDVSWSFAEHPAPRRRRSRSRTIGRRFRADRAKVAQRVAELCPLHQTLTHSPAMTVQRAARPRWLHERDRYAGVTRQVARAHRPGRALHGERTGATADDASPARAPAFGSPDTRLHRGVRRRVPRLPGSR